MPSPKPHHNRPFNTLLGCVWHHQPQHLYHVLPTVGHATHATLCSAFYTCFPFYCQGNWEIWELTMGFPGRQWLGLSTCIAVAQVQSLVGELNPPSHQVFPHQPPNKELVKGPPVCSRAGTHTRTHAGYKDSTLLIKPWWQWWSAVSRRQLYLHYWKHVIKTLKRLQKAASK